MKNKLIWLKGMSYVYKYEASLVILGPSESNGGPDIILIEKE